METSTYDVVSSATQLKKAVEEGRITNPKLAELVMERLGRLSGVKSPITDNTAHPGPSSGAKVASAWVHTWKWIV
jgi:hypothetical protein